MILLGYGVKGDEELDSVKPQKDVAQRQLNQIKAYLAVTGHIFVYLRDKHYSQLSEKVKQSVALSEADSLSIKETKLSGKGIKVYAIDTSIKEVKAKQKSLNWSPKARKKRWHHPSWMYQRLYDLINSPIEVKVFESLKYFSADGLTIVFAKGGRKNNIPIGHPVDKLYCLLDYKSLSTKATNTGVPEKFALQLAGKIYIHELAVHAWRNIKFGIYSKHNKPKGKTTKEWFIKNTDHLHNRNSGGVTHKRRKEKQSKSFDERSLADIEADYLEWYLTFNPETKNFKDKDLTDRITAVVLFYSKSMKPQVDIFGVNWFTFAELKKRI